MIKKVIFLLMAIILLMGCAREKKNSDITVKRDSRITERAIQRKARTIEILREHSIPYSDKLAPLPDENTVKSRTTKEVAYRAICLAVVAIKGDGRIANKKDKIAAIRANYKIDEYLSPEENAFLEDDNPLEEDSALFSWRYEAYYVLLWALQFVPELNFPDRICNVEAALSFLLDPAKGDFVKKAKLRSMTEIFDETDLIYRYHWAIIQINMNDPSAPLPGGLNYDVVYERHYALNWLVRYKNAKWDEITPDA